MKMRRAKTPPHYVQEEKVHVRGGGGGGGVAAGPLRREGTHGSRGDEKLLLGCVVVMQKVKEITITVPGGKDVIKKCGRSSSNPRDKKKEKHWQKEQVTLNRLKMTSWKKKTEMHNSSHVTTIG